MTVEISTPYDIFFTTSGSPLNNGKVYIGASGMNPETNPITVYFDEDKTIVAAQPLITSGGYIYRNGSPAKIYTSSDYSMTVKDSEGRLVFYSPSSVLASSSIYEGIANVKNFGAVGDGVADDTDAIQSALDTGGLVFFPSGTYYVTKTLVVSSNVTVKGNNAIIKASSTISNSESLSHFGVFYAYGESHFSFDGITVDATLVTVLPSGAASIRCITLKSCSYYSVKNCTFLTTGGGVASIGCNNYVISENFNYVTSNKADAVIDNWGENGSGGNNFNISGNIINGESVARWGILSTGVVYGAYTMNMEKFNITNNIISDCVYDAIWVNGRDAINSDFTISGNVMSNNRKGISVSDSMEFSIDGNVIEQTTNVGMDFWQETSLGGATGAVDGIVSNNVLSNVCTAGSNPAIFVKDISSNLSLIGNSVKGGSYIAGIQFGSSTNYCLANSNNIIKGSGDYIYNYNSTNRVNGMTFTPTLAGLSNVSSASLARATYTIASRVVTVYFSIAVQPTSSATITQLTMTLPVDTTLVSAQLLYGNVTGGDMLAGGTFGIIYGDTGLTKAMLTFKSCDNASKYYYGSFSYAI